MPSRPVPRVTVWLYAMACLKLAIHLAANRGYGIFRDELYYLACADHLDWGYVDHPPLIALIAAFARWAFGDSLSGLRLLPAVAGALVVLLAGLIARELGGGRWAQLLAALATLVAPGYLVVHNFLSMNVFDHLFWAACFYVFVRLLKGDDPRLWLLFGLLAGIGLQNKISVLFLGFGVAVGLALAWRWDLVRTRWIWWGGALAGVIFLPHVLWQISHGWPTLEFMHNASTYKNAPLPPLAFLAESILEMHPMTLPIWLAGLGYTLFARDGRRFRALGVGFLAVFALLALTKAKPYYLQPAYLSMLAAGAVAVEAATRGRIASWLRPATFGVLAVGGVVLAPLALPVLPVQGFMRYSARLGLAPRAAERSAIGPLPQHFADMLGWEVMVKTVAGVYQALPEADRRRCAIFASNYGEAGAIDFFGPAYGLPRAISGHNSYFLWGTHGSSGEVLIIIGGRAEDHRRSYAEVRQAATIVRPLSMPYENDVPVFLCLRPKVSLAEIWPHVKHFI